MVSIREKKVRTEAGLTYFRNMSIMQFMRIDYKLLKTTTQALYIEYMGVPLWVPRTICRIISDKEILVHTYLFRYIYRWRRARGGFAFE